MLSTMVACEGEKPSVEDTSTENTTQTTVMDPIICDPTKGIVYANSQTEYQELLEKAKLGEIEFPENFIIYEQISEIGELDFFRFNLENNSYLYYLKTRKKTKSGDPIDAILVLEITPGRKTYNFSNLKGELWLNMPYDWDEYGIVLHDDMPDGYKNGTYIKNSVKYEYVNGSCVELEWYSKGLTYTVIADSYLIRKCFFDSEAPLGIFWDDSICDDPVKAFDEMLYGTQQP